MNPNDTLQLIRALEDKEKARTRTSNWLAWGAVLVGTSMLGLIMRASDHQLKTVQSASAATAAQLSTLVAARDLQITRLENAISASSADVTSKNAAINQLTVIIEQMKAASGLVEKAGRDLLLTLSDQNTVTFAIAQDTLSCEQQEKLAENLTLLRYAKTFPDFHIEITGHTDDTWRGKSDHSQAAQDANKELSLKRAVAVKEFLGLHDIPTDRIDTIGRGMRWPVGVTDEADLEMVGRQNADEPARRANRRVEVLIKGVNLNVPTARRSGL